jgi:hypothetical protein
MRGTTHPREIYHRREIYHGVSNLGQSIHIVACRDSVGRRQRALNINWICAAIEISQGEIRKTTEMTDYFAARYLHSGGAMWYIACHGEEPSGAFSPKGAFVPTSSASLPALLLLPPPPRPRLHCHRRHRRCPRREPFIKSASK